MQISECSDQIIPEFDWNNKWLKGDEYSYILQNIDAYCRKYKFLRFPKKTHPESIYTSPQNGMIYFVEGNAIGSEFGFPRVEIRKHFRWKKMNFTTDLPKSRPYVTYIVASAVKCERFFPNSKKEGPAFRMHAVVLNKEGRSYSARRGKTGEINELEGVIQKEYILCHIRKIDNELKNNNINKEEIKNKDNNEEIIHKKRKISENENSYINSEENKWKVKFRKFKLNTFQFFWMNKMLQKKIDNLIVKFTEENEKKENKKIEGEWFPEMIEHEIRFKKEEKHDYAKLLSLIT